LRTVSALSAAESGPPRFCTVTELLRAGEAGNGPASSWNRWKKLSWTLARWAVESTAKSVSGRST
jgi:hypothetical protein